MLDYFDVYFVAGLKVVAPALIVLAICKLIKSM
jgi:hypothetical protein